MRPDDASRMAFGQVSHTGHVLASERQRALSWLFLAAICLVLVLVLRTFAAFAGPVAFAHAVVAFVSLTWAAAVAAVMQVETGRTPGPRILTGFALLAVIVTAVLLGALRGSPDTLTNTAPSVAVITGECVVHRALSSKGA